MDRMDDLITFLRNRLDDDERIAKAAAWDEDMSARWTAGSSSHDKRRQGPRWYVMDAYDDGVVGDVDPQGNDDEGVARHIARHDPARVMRDIEAKRLLLTEYAEVLHNEDADYEWAGGWANGLGQAVALLAVPYADHPDYQDTWRP